MKKYNIWSRIFPLLMVIILLVMHCYQPLLADEIENRAQNEPILNAANENGRDDKIGEDGSLTLLSACTLEDALKNATYIYIDGVYGDDECLGITKENAVKTFARARELANQHKKINTIYVVGTVPISGEISLEDTNAILKRDPSFNDYLLLVAADTMATLSNIIVDGNSAEATSAEKSLISCCGILNIKEDAVLQNNKSGSENVEQSGEGDVIYSTDTPSKISINVTNYWEDQNNEAGMRPESVTIRLLADGVDTGESLVLTENNSWKGEFSDLDEYKNEIKIAYTIKGSDIEGYTYEITGDTGEGFVITNCPVLGAQSLSGNGVSVSIYWLSSAFIIVAGGLLLVAFLREAWLGG